MACVSVVRWKGFFTPVSPSFNYKKSSRLGAFWPMAGARGPPDSCHVRSGALPELSPVARWVRGLE